MHNMKSKLKRILCATALVIAAYSAAFAEGSPSPASSPAPAPAATPVITSAPLPSAAPLVSPEPSPSPSPSPAPEPSATLGELEITQSPQSVSVKPGASATFSAEARNATSRKWQLTDGSTTIDAENISEHFSGVTSEGSTTDSLTLTGVTKDMNGWSVYCVYRGPSGSIATNRAKLTVADAPKSTRAPKATAAQSAPLQTAEPTPLVTPAPHLHSFSSKWKSDESLHWQECECGEKTNVGSHAVTKWIVKRKATKELGGEEEGVCAVCGRTVLRSVEYQPSGKGKIILIALIAAAAIAAAAVGMRKNSRKRWRLR